MVALGTGTYIWSGEGCDGSTCSHLTPYALDATMTLDLPSARACVRVQADGRLSTQYRRLRWPGDHRRYTSAELSPGSLWVTVTTSCTESTEFAVQNLTVENRWTATPDGLTTFQIPDSDGDQAQRWVLPARLFQTYSMPTASARGTYTRMAIPVPPGWKDRAGLGSGPCVYGQFTVGGEASGGGGTFGTSAYPPLTVIVCDQGGARSGTFS